MRILLFLVTAIALSQTRSQSPSYLLGPDDQVTVRVLDLDEIGSGPFRIDMLGYLNVPLAGRLHAAGLNVEQLEAALAERLKQYLQNPVINVSVSEFRSQPVSVLGAVNAPGVHQIRGRKTLVEVISEAGGLRNDAGSSIKITRHKGFGSIPLNGAALDPSGEFYVGEVSVKSVMEARSPQENIPIEPNDVITVPRAEMIYVVGAVKRAGGFVLTEREHISVLQALSMAEGLAPVSAAGNARILRASGGNSSRQEIDVNINKILNGQSKDIPLQAEDILFIPNSKAKSAGLRGVEAAIQLATGVVIWHR